MPDVRPRVLRHPTPLGPMCLLADETGLCGAFFADARPGAPAPTPGDPGPVLTQAARQLDEYFAGQRRTFALALSPRGTDFQLAVWEALRHIPYGETRTYAQVAAMIGRPGACRAVGAANRANPLWVLIPCHRVVRAGGAPGGYAGGIYRKQWLLTLEQNGRPYPQA